MSAGIDYGMGTTNIDKETGIRYGVIPQNAVLQAWADSSEADYGKPHCPKCENEAVEPDEAPDDDSEEEFKPYRNRPCCGDYCCLDCKIYFDSEDAFGDEPLGWILDDSEYLSLIHI